MTQTPKVAEEKQGDIWIFKLQGHLDTPSSTELEKHIFNHIHQGERQILLDFCSVASMSSAGMRMILSVAKKLKTFEKGKLVLASVSPSVLDLLKMAGVSHLLECADTLDLALQRFS